MFLKFIIDSMIGLSGLLILFLIIQLIHKSSYSKNKQSKKYKSLSPKSKLVNNKYIEVLEKAFKNDNVCNIAITGDYGVGKSSVIKDYEREKRDNFIYVSAIHLARNEKDTEKEDEEIQKEIEKSLLQQLLIRLNIKDAPLSRFKTVAENSHLNTITFFSGLIVIILAQIVAFILKENWIEPTKLFLSKFKILNIFFLYIESHGILNSESFQLLFLVVTSAFTLWFALRKILIHYKLPKVEFSVEKHDAQLNAELESVAQPEDLDSNINEILYLFESVSKKYGYTFVFEDLDRYSADICIPILVKLKQLNMMLNSRAKKRKIKFVYVLKDSIFSEAQRNRLSEDDPYKFFDFIVPVIPFIDSQNSKYYMFQEWGYYDIDTQLFKDISQYLYDYRKILSIGNEFKVYYE